jgi:hypothetical protein
MRLCPDALDVLRMNASEYLRGRCSFPGSKAEDLTAAFIKRHRIGPHIPFESAEFRNGQRRPEMGLSFLFR